MSASMQFFPVASPRHPNKPNTPDQVIERQMDELQRLAEEERDRQLGSTWHSEVNTFYTLTGLYSTSAPSFRPRVIIPELQTLKIGRAHV